MPRKPYRVEIIYTKRGNKRIKQYYITRDVLFGNNRKKIRRYICSGDVSPSEPEVQRFYEQHAYEIELRVARKRAEMSSSLYTPGYLSRDQINAIEEIRSVYKSLKDLLTVNELEVYERDFEVNYIHGTVFIEGNTFSLREAYDLVVRGISPNDKNLREINEVQNFKNVVFYRNAYRGKVNLDFIKGLHSFVMNNIDADSAGAFRRTDLIGIEGCDFRVCPSEVIEPELKNIISKYYQRLEEGYHPFEEAVLFHHSFEIIHPFTDGNGRVGRELFNYMLMKEKYPRLLFLGKNKQKYHKALKLGDEENYADMVSIFRKIIMEQRYKILYENLQKVIQPIKKTGQVRLTDFITA